MKSSWSTILSITDVERIIEASHAFPQLIFKHSSRCNLSATIYEHLEDWKDESQYLQLHYLDLIAYRQVSDFIESHFRILHESPQVILIHGGKAIYDESHFRIQKEKLASIASSLEATSL